MEIRKIWEIIWRRKWIIIQAFLVISLTAIMGSYFITPTYETSAKVLIKTSSTASSLLSSIGLQNFALPSQSTTSIETNIALATVDPVLERVISRLQLTDRSGDIMKPSKLRESKFIISTIFPEPYVEVNEIEDTEDLLEIQARSVDPKEAAMIANAVAAAYVEENLKGMSLEYGGARSFIEDQIKGVKAEYLDVLKSVRDFKIEEKTVDLVTETRLAIEKMAELMKEKENNIIDISETRARLEALKIQLGRQSETVVSSSAVSENPQIESLKKNLTNFKFELVEALTEKTSAHPDVINLRRKLEEARAELRAEVDIFQKSSKDLEGLERDIAALEAHLKDINTDIAKYLSLLYTLPGKEFIQSQLELKLTASQELYSSLLEYRYQVGVAEAMAISDIRLVEAAIEPDIDKPASPNKVLNGVIGILLGLMFGFGLALLTDYVDDTLKTSEDIKEHELTFLGSIPRFRRKETSIISERDPKDYIYESYRTVRNNIKFASLDRPLNSLLISSSMEGEGKTTTAVNLGISFAHEGKETLIIDTDLHIPVIHKIFEVSNSVGITSILVEEVKPEDAIKKTNIEGLSLLTSGPIPPDPGQLVESVKIKHLIKDLSQQYDTIILDTPPVLAANDAIILAGYVDISILILESGKVTRRALSEAEELFKRANILPIGAILNKVKIERGGYYYHYYYKDSYYKDKKK